MKRCQLAAYWSLLLLLLAPPAPVVAGEPDNKPKKGEVKLEVRSWEGTEKLVAAHKGKVVLVDVWTTTCGTCVEEFPRFVALGKQFPADKVSLISLNCDYDGIKGKPPEFYRARVQSFLEKHEAAFDNVLLDLAFIDFLNKIDLSSTPAVLVYGPDGKLVKRFDNDKAEKVADEFTLEQVMVEVVRILSDEQE